MLYLYYLVVYLPLCKYESVGMIIFHIWKSKKCLKTLQTVYVPSRCWSISHHIHVNSHDRPIWRFPQNVGTVNLESSIYRFRLLNGNFRILIYGGTLVPSVWTVWTHFLGRFPYIAPPKIGQTYIVSTSNLHRFRSQGPRIPLEISFHPVIKHGLLEIYHQNQWFS